MRQAHLMIEEVLYNVVAISDGLVCPREQPLAQVYT